MILILSVLIWLNDFSGINIAYSPRFDRLMIWYNEPLVVVPRTICQADSMCLVRSSKPIKSACIYRSILTLRARVAVPEPFHGGEKNPIARIGLLREPSNIRHTVGVRVGDHFELSDQCSETNIQRWRIPPINHADLIRNLRHAISQLDWDRSTNKDQIQPSALRIFSDFILPHHSLGGISGVLHGFQSGIKGKLDETKGSDSRKKLQSTYYHNPPSPI